MKRLLVLMLSVCIAVGIMTPDTVMAATTTTDVTYLEDGSYVVTELTVYTNARSTDISAKKEYIRYFEEGGPKQWRITIFGNFSYVEGESSWCTYASHSISIYNTIWAFLNDVSYIYEDCALFDATIELYSNGTLASSTNFHGYLGCDEYGNCY